MDIPNPPSCSGMGQTVENALDVFSAAEFSLQHTSLTQFKRQFAVIVTALRNAGASDLTEKMEYGVERLVFR